MGGSERLAHSLISKIDPDKYEPYLAYFFGDNIHSEFRNLKVPIFKISKNRRFDPPVMKNIDSLIGEKEIDIVHAQHFMPMIYAFYGCKVKRRIGLVCTFHSQWEVEDIPIRWRLVGSFLIRKIDYAVAVSPRVAKSLQNRMYVGSNNIKTIINGVDLEKYSTITKLKNIRRNLSIEDDDIVIGTVGNLKKVKNQIMLLRSFELLLEEEPKVKLIIIGQGFAGDRDNAEPELREFIKRQGLETKVFLLGYREDVYSILKEIDIFCLTSKMEGLPISLIEAMASGVPVIGTNVQGINDVIKNGQNGLLVKDNEVNQLKKAIVSLIRNPKFSRKLAEAGNKYAMVSYSLKNCVDNYERLYSTIGRRTDHTRWQDSH